MDELDRNVGGLRCRDVLEHLSAYVDGELDAEQVRRVESHLLGCDRCERFGGVFTHTISALRAHLGAAEPLGPGMEGRLRERIRAAEGLGGS